MTQTWYEQNYRRLLLDMHISALDERFMTQFDAQTFIQNALTANVKAVTFSANTHTGMCYYPTKVGVEHPATKGKDLLKQMIDAAHSHGLDAIIYYCAIYIEDYPLKHPESMVVAADGTSQRMRMSSHGMPRRFLMVCPNNVAYRAFVVDQLTEICQNYDFEGVWPDMAMWPTVCYCESCQARYAAEIGGEIARVADWRDPVWVRFQKQRQLWLREFAQLETDTIKPNATVAHQSQEFAGDWLFGASVEMAETTDWLSSDYYGDRTQLSFYAKHFYNLSKHKPFEHLNGWVYPNIHEHVVQRTEAYMRAILFAAVMNHGAPAFIDALDPMGRMDAKRYQRAGVVLREVEPYEPHIGGQFRQDVAIYFSYDAVFDMKDNGKPVMDAMYNFEPGKDYGSREAHRNAAIHLARILAQYNIPFGVITKKQFADLSQYQIIIVPNMALITDEERAAFMRYVEAGGSLYVSKSTSIIDERGNLQSNFLLSELIGADYMGETQEVMTYVAPTAGHEHLFETFSAEQPVTVRGTQLMVRAHAGTETVATVTLPYTDPKGTAYAAILTDPPGITTDYPSVLLHPYGKGRVMYAAGVIEGWDYDPQMDVFHNLLGLLQTRPFAFETDAPKAVEVTLFDQPERSRFVVHLINFPAELPPVPIYDIKLSIRLDGHTAVRVTQIPSGDTIAHTVVGDRVAFSAPRLDSYLMLAVEYTA